MDARDGKVEAWHLRESMRLSDIRRKKGRQREREREG